MKKTYPLILAAAISVTAFASPSSDSLRSCVHKVQVMTGVIENLQDENESLKSEVATMNTIIVSQKAEIDSLKSNLTNTSENVVALADSLNINITTTQQQIQSSSDALNETISSKSLIGICGLVLLAIVIAVVAFVFGRIMAKSRDEVVSLSEKADKLNEEIVSRLSSEMNDMQAISQQLSTLSKTAGTNPESEQKLITTLADRITFMEMTLYKMDSSVRGHKQLSKSIKQMKDNLLANGYELVDMLGKDYHDGMKVTANFVEDEELPSGKQIITGIIKPQINYNGKMIQSAQITVSQNI